MDKPKYRYMHRDGCGKIAFYLIEKSNPLDMPRRSNTILLNGEHPKLCDLITCCSCGMVLLHLSTGMVEEND
jgi:hypothetical protein